MLFGIDDIQRGAGLVLVADSKFGSRQKLVFCSTFDDIFLNIGMIDVGCNYQPHPHMGFPW